MDTFETSATVGDHGQLRLTGVPFAEGTQVEVKVSPKTRVEEEHVSSGDEELTISRARLVELFSMIKGFRNTPKMSREELYDRGSLH